MAFGVSALNGKTYATSSSNDLVTEDISPERGIRIPLWLTEKVLRKRLADFPSITFFTEYEVTDFIFEFPIMSVITQHRGKKKIFKARFIVGCDGANSITRRKAGMLFRALSAPQRVLNVLFESRELEKLITVDRGFLYYLLESDSPGAIGPVDLKQGLWYAQIRDNTQVASIADLDVSTILEKMVGFAFQKQIVQSHFWHMNIQIAQDFSKDNRIFLVGDSAHAFVPTGGFGLNTGLGDVTNLGWKLAQVVKGQSDGQLLASFDAERRPICLHNLQLAQKNADDLLALRTQHNPQTNPEAFAKANAKLANQYVNALEATLGYRYGAQEISCQKKYTPSVAVGYFLPHRKLQDAESIYDKLSPIHWTLIVGEGLSDDDFAQLSIMEIDVMQLPKDTYSFVYVLIRPDWHIAYVADRLIMSTLKRVIN